MKRRTLGILVVAICALSNAACGGGGGDIGTGGGGEGPSVFVTGDTDILDPQAPSDILQFPATANGIANPTSTITGPGGVFFTGLTADGTGAIYVVGDIFDVNAGQFDAVEILVYAPDASGKAKPTRNITGTLTGLNNSDFLDVYDGLAVDGSGNIYVLANTDEGQGISIFSSTANGNVAPARIIAGAATNLQDDGSFGNQLAVSSAGDIYVTNNFFGGIGPSSILIFDSGSNGNVAPTGTISGPNTMITALVAGVALDSAGNIYVTTKGSDVEPGTPAILEFSAGSTGNVPPIRIISGLATMITNPGNLTLDSDGNIYVLDFAAGILKFDPNATGNVAPIATNPAGSTSSIAVH